MEPAEKGNSIFMNQPGWQKQVARVLRLRWLILGTVIVVNLINMLQRVAPTVVADRVMADFSLTAIAFGSLAAVYFYVYAAMQVPAGLMIDTIGSRRTIILGSLAAGLGSIVFGLAPTLLVAYIGRFLMSLGCGTMWLVILKVLTEWFRTREFATMSGLSGALAQIGGLLGATPLAILVVLVGWRMSFELIGLVTLAIGAMCWLVVKNRPSDVGLPSIAEIESYESGSVQVTPQSTTDAPTMSLMTKIKIVLGNKHSWPPLIVALGGNAPFGVFITTWGIPYIMQVYGMSREAAANYMLVGTIGIIAGLLSIGYISDKLMVRRKLPIILFASVGLIIWLIMALWNGGKPPSQFLYLLLFFMGPSATVFVVGVACAKEVNSPTVSGLAMGFANMGGFIGIALLQPLFGYVLDLGWQGVMVEGARVYPLSAYQNGFMLSVAATLISIIAGLLIKETKCQNIYPIIKG